MKPSKTFSSKKKKPYHHDVFILISRIGHVFFQPKAVKASLSSRMQSGAPASQLQGVNLDSRVTLSW